MSTEWFYECMGEAVGPLTSEQFVEHAKQGKVLADTLVCRPGDTQWVPASTVKGLLQHLHPSKKGPPPPPPPRATSESREAKSPDMVEVTTGDLQREYQILGPVFFQVSNKGIFSSQLAEFKKRYQTEISQLRKRGLVDDPRADWSFLFLEWGVGQNDFDAAFFIAVQELKKRAAVLGADAIVAMRQDIDLDTNAFAFFYLQMYGTAVKYV